MERRKFTREFKLEAVRLIKNRGVSYVQASQDLSVHTSQLRDWVKKFSDDPQHAFPSIRAGARREAESCPRRSSSPILQNMIFGTHKTSSGGWSGWAQHLILRHEKDQRLPGQHITDCETRL